MRLLDRLAEDRIAEAQRRGEFDNLRGQGRPLSIDDDALRVPEELRLAYRILENGGFVPEGVAVRKEIHDTEALLRHLDDGEQRTLALRRLDALMTRLHAASGVRTDLRTEQAYDEKLLLRLEKA